MRFRSTNPVYSKINKMEWDQTSYQEATYRGVAAKTLYFTLMTLLGAIIGIYALSVNGTLQYPVLIGSVIIAFVSSLLAFIRPEWTKIAGTVYCLTEGLLVGVVSFIFEAMVPGVVVAGLLGTIAVVLVVGFVFMTKLIRVTSKFVRFLMIVSISFIITMIAFWLLQLILPSVFGDLGANLRNSSLVSIIMIALATFYLLFDMENIRQIVEGGQPKFLEWFASFGLIFTVIWLYMEILPLMVRILLAGDR
ncbi:MAG: Bax inhibitor-1/YccA family protein [Bacilli bacterium]|jgi:uncharacterized YccA/Bax inhibitor family protein|nr:Bax inhibitor-1/YccA family protein [Bacilli bacterium]